MKRIAVLLALVLALPLSASALTNAEIQARIATLLAQISALQLQLQSLNSATNIGTSVTTPTTPVARPTLSCPNLSRALSLGMRGTDVSQLQAYLESEGYYSYAYSAGVFDPATEIAVQKWQAEHGIVFSGTAESTGYGLVGPRTRNLIALNCRARQNSTQVITTGVTQTGTGQLTCPIAPPPTTVCSTGWQAVTDSYGCTQSYRCSVPLGGTPTPACTVHPIPTCISGYVPQSLGTDANSCNIGYQCVHAGSGQVSGSVTRSASSLRVGDILTLSWSFANAPAGSIVQLDLLDESGSRVGDGVMRGCNNSGALSGTCSWTIPATNAPHSYCPRYTDMPGICAEDFTATKRYKIRARVQSGWECRGYCAVGTYTVYTSAESELFTIVK